MPLTRRQLLAAAPLALAPAAFSRAAAPDPFAAIEATLGSGARLGVAALDTASGRALRRRPRERFAFCSTIKFPLAAAILAEVDAGRLSLDRAIAVPPNPRKLYAPVLDAWKGDTIPLHELCRAAVAASDNAAANALFPLAGGPAGLTRFLTAHGAAPTRSDRIETELNTNLPGDPRDTTTPDAMLSFARTVVSGRALSPGSTARLAEWLGACATGAHRLRAGLPPEWRVGDKTGTGERGAVNDVAIAWPAPGRSPMLIACYIDAPAAPLAAAEAAQAAVARVVAALT